MPSQTARRLLLTTAVADSHEIQSWDASGAYMRAPNSPNYRVTMIQPPKSDGSYKEPGKISAMRRAIQGDPSSNQQWDTQRVFG